jgi:hypothetical protein
MIPRDKLDPQDVTRLMAGAIDVHIHTSFPRIMRRTS